MSSSNIYTNAKTHLDLLVLVAAGISKSSILRDAVESRVQALEKPELRRALRNLIPADIWTDGTLRCLLEMPEMEPYKAIIERLIVLEEEGGHNGE